VEPVVEAMGRLEHRIRFVSCEPLLEPLDLMTLTPHVELVIVGAKSNGATKEQPMTEWVEKILKQCRSDGCSVWFKDNLVFRPQEEPRK